MDGQVVLHGDAHTTDSPAPGINLGNFNFGNVDAKINKARPHGHDHQPTAQVVDADEATPPPPPLGPLSSFTGAFVGLGFNTIFRPSDGTNVFENPVDRTGGKNPDDNVLELNLTKETLSFSKPLGKVPNRGLGGQKDIMLNGVPYVQAIQDVTNPDTGRPNGTPTDIHLEPGLWMHVPATNPNPIGGETLVRMASIPHGTTINAQAQAPNGPVSGGPDLSNIIDIKPFTVGNPAKRIGKATFQALDVSNQATPRIPQDLSTFIKAQTITQQILDDPNTVLRNAINGQKIIKTTTFEVSTGLKAPTLGGGIANINFLEGTTGGGPNADVALMTSKFFIETIEHQLVVAGSSIKAGSSLLIQPAPPHPGGQVPAFSVSAKPFSGSKTITVTSTQIQYSQVVNLNFAGLTWPHVSVATLVPADPLPVTLF